MPLYLPFNGGAERHTRELSLEIQKMGYQVTILTTDALDIPSLFQRHNNLTEPTTYDYELNLIRYPVTRLPFFKLLIKCTKLSLQTLDKIGLHSNVHRLWADTLKILPNTPKMYCALLKTKNYDIVNSTPFPFSHHYYLLKIFDRNKIPFIITPRMHVLDPLFQRSDLYQVAKQANALIAITEYEKEYFTKNGVDPDKIFVTGIGVSPELYEISYSEFKRNHGIPEDYDIVLFIGRIVEYKGIAHIIRSMKRVWKTHPKTYFVIIGKSTSYTNEIQKMIRGKRRILLIPDASERIKIQALKNSNLLILPSKYESFGGVFLEAWTNGIPVIGAGIPTIKTIIDEGVNGLLLDNIDSNEIADKITYLLENKKTAMEMGANGKQKTLSKYSWNRIAKATLDVYNYVISAY